MRPPRRLSSSSLRLGRREMDSPSSASPERLVEFLKPVVESEGCLNMISRSFKRTNKPKLPRQRHTDSDVSQRFLTAPQRARSCAVRVHPGQRRSCFPRGTCAHAARSAASRLVSAPDEGLPGEGLPGAKDDDVLHRRRVAVASVAIVGANPHLAPGSMARCAIVDMWLGVPDHNLLGKDPHMPGLDRAWPGSNLVHPARCSHARCSRGALLVDRRCSAGQQTSATPAHSDGRETELGSSYARRMPFSPRRRAVASSSGVLRCPETAMTPRRTPDAVALSLSLCWRMFGSRTFFSGNGRGCPSDRGKSVLGVKGDDESRTSPSRGTDSELTRARRQLALFRVGTLEVECGNAPASRLAGCCATATPG